MRSRTATSIAGREGKSPSGADPRARRQRLRRCQPDAVAARRARRRLRHDHAQARLAARGPARRPRPDGRPAGRLEPRGPARTRPAPHGLQLRRLRRLLVRDRQPAHLPDQLPVVTRLLAAAGVALDRRLTSTPAARRNTATTPPAPARQTPPRPTATTPSPRSPRPT